MWHLFSQDLGDVGKLRLWVLLHDLVALVVAVQHEGGERPLERRRASLGAPLALTLALLLSTSLLCLRTLTLLARLFDERSLA